MSPARAVILMYHRIGGGYPDPRSLCVSPERFAEHLGILGTTAHPMRLKDLQAALAEDRCQKRAVAVTLDDGYADNLTVAKPLLEEHGIPATVFVTTGGLPAGGEFWWDQLDFLLQPGYLPTTLELCIGGTSYRWNLGEAAAYSESEWRRDYEWSRSVGPPTSRHSLYLDLYRLFKPLPDEERRLLMSDLEAWRGAVFSPRDTHRTLSLGELNSLCEGDLVDIGAHTVTHPVLTQVSVAVQRNELHESKATLEAALRVPVSAFAYPFGTLTNETVQLVQEARYLLACTTEPASAGHETDPFELPRFEAPNAGGDAFRQQMEHWFAGP